MLLAYARKLEATVLLYAKEWNECKEDYAILAEKLEKISALVCE